jgi:uncharacterized protein
MRVNIDEIKEGGIAREWDLTRERLDAMVSDDPAGYRAASPLHVSAWLEKLERRVILDASAKVELTAPCGRCLAPVPVALPMRFTLTLVPKDEYVHPEHGGTEERDHGDGAKNAGSFDPDDASEDTYTGRVIDIEPLLREQLLLALPGYPVCRESCKGLCSVCGGNLNERDCGCDRHVPDPRWAGLKDIKL